MQNKNQASLVEELFYLSGAFKSAIDGGFFAREHAAAIFKAQLRDAGYEIPGKKTEKGGVE